MSPLKLRILMATSLSIQATSHGVSQEKHKELIDRLSSIHKLTQDQKDKISSILKKSPSMGQGVKASVHPLTTEQCKQIRQNAGINDDGSAHMDVCGHPFMVPLKKADGSKTDTCIDQFEFPNIPCDFPVTWVKAHEAHEMCQAIGKRLCDADEWEGGCGGTVYAPHFPSSPEPFASVVKSERARHNANRKVLWAYGDKANHQLCAMGSKKSAGCDAALQSGRGVYEACGTNTYPSGSFPQCASKDGVNDIHGNAAEHMNLALSPNQLTSKGGSGVTEMKGSWFIFQTIEAHPDDCYWRAPFWHGTRLMDSNSHNNYHLGFRCCKSVN